MTWSDDLASITLESTGCRSERRPGLQLSQQQLGHVAEGGSRDPNGADLMAMAKRDEGKKVNSNINVTPMVDVMLVLLIIFMVITPMLNNKVNVDLPKVNAAVIMENANKEDAITVAVTRDGKVFLGGDQVSLDRILERRVQSLLRRRRRIRLTTRSVYLRADIRANYGKVMDTIDALRTAGVSQLNLLTDKT